MPRPLKDTDPDTRERRIHPLSIWYGFVLPLILLFAVAWFAPLLPGDREELTVTFTNGGGIVESADGSRTELSEGTSVGQGDRVLVRPGASVTFAVRDGHNLTLTDSTSLSVERSRRSVLGGRTWTDLSVDQGEVRVSGEGRPRASMDVGLPNGVAGVRGTDFSVDAGPGRAAISVHDGEVSLSKTPGDPAQLTPGQGAILAGSGPLVRPLPEAPLIRPLPDEATVIRDPGTLLTWTSVRGAAEYAISLGPDSALQSVVFHTRTDSAFLEVPILDVDEPLFARVQAVTSDGLRGHPSESYPIEIAYHWAQGRSLRDEGDVEESLAEFELALERRPDHPGLHREVGWSNYILGRHTEAFTAYERARELAPEDTEMLVELARVHFWLRNYSEAESIYRSVLERQPEYADALWGLGDTYRVLGRRGEALDLVRRALEADPNHPYARSTLRELRGGG